VAGDSLLSTMQF